MRGCCYDARAASRRSPAVSCSRGAQGAGYLAGTDHRLFSEAFTLKRALRLESDPNLAERVDAFVGRVGRLQDTAGDKLLLVFLSALGETPGAAIDNLNRAERLGPIASVDDWMVMRKLRNQMVHEYVEDPTILTAALQAGHAFVPALVGMAEGFWAEASRRGGLDVQERGGPR